jgi:hypothetical protein
MAWTLPIRADAAVLPPGNFKMDATVHPSHGRLRDHRPIVHPSVRKRPRDNPNSRVRPDGKIKINKNKK